MLIRHFVPNSIRICQKHPLALFVILLIFIVGSQIVSAQQQIARDAYAIFEQRCLICHGPQGAYKETLLIEHNALIENGTVVPGNPNDSELYKRLITTDTAKRMPLGSQLSTQAINTIRNWILADAPDWAATTTPTGDFISHGEILNEIETHLMSLSSFDRSFARYFTMTHLYNAGVSAQILQEYRKALYKLVNSLSWGVEVINPESIDSQGTIFYIDLRHYEWDVNDGWGQIEAVYPYHISFDAPAQATLKQQLGRLQTETNSSVPSVHVDWFLATASLPPLYHNLLSLPLTDRALEARLEVDVRRNISNAPGVRVWRAGTNHSGVSQSNRVLERHTSRYGAYWKSYDFAGNVGTQNAFLHPLDFTPDGGEVIFNLPNGLQGYYIVDATGSRLNAAPISIVADPAASDPTVRTGLSCFGCHIEGMNTFEDQVRDAIERRTNPTYDKAQALRLYVEKADMDALVNEDRERYREALAETGGAFDDIEPISRFHKAFEGPVDAAHAAAVVGLETEDLLEKIRENIGLQNAGLLVLESNGSMKRDTWTSSFQDVLFALNFPIKDVPPPIVTPPVVTPPRRPPGTVVQISDLNLRRAIAAALGKGANASITVEEMEKLTSSLVVPDRNIQDLTGLQFAINLRHLRLDGNEVSDISPLASLINLRDLRLHDNLLSDISPVRGLINLTRLEVDDNQLSDISPVRGLTNLTHLEFNRTQVSDISPVRGLINLTVLEFKRTLVSDISPVRGLTNLIKLHFHDGTLVTDLSPIAGLSNIEDLAFNGDNVSNLSPVATLTSLKSLYLGHFDGLPFDLSVLAGLTNLEIISIHDADISDLSPLAGLTRLRELFIGNSGISDISALAGLTELTRIDLATNEISDISALAGLTNLRWVILRDNQIADLALANRIRANIPTFVWHDNPGFPKVGPKIEGPWLWVVLRNTNPSTADLLSQVSGGTVTETEIATHGAIEGQPVGDDVWTFRSLPPTGWNNVEKMLGDRIDGATVYGTVSLHAPRQQVKTLYVGSHNEFRVWLNGELIHDSLRYHASFGYTDSLPVTLKQGRNVLLVSVRAQYNAHFGFEPGTEYTVANPGITYTFSKTPIHREDTFTLDIGATDVFDMAGWQFDIAFDPTDLEAISVTEGNFLKMASSTLFQGGTINNAAGRIEGISVIRLSTRGASGTGTLVQVTFKAKASGETRVTLEKFQFGAITGEHIPAGPHQIRFSVEGQLATGDVNRDGRVSVLDLILIAQQLGQRVAVGSPADLNGDGVVSILDLILTARSLGSTTAPSAPGVEAEGMDPAMIEGWLAQARLEDDGSLAFKQGMEILENLLAALIPEETALLRNYPNPFNPETWIPYQLAQATDVTLTIYDAKGVLVHQLDIGYQQAGHYIDRTRAAYWDGCNHLGESVGSGIYFYQLRAGDYSTARKMLILK